MAWGDALRQLEARAGRGQRQALIQELAAQTGSYAARAANPAMTLSFKAGLGGNELSNTSFLVFHLISSTESTSHTKQFY